MAKHRGYDSGHCWYYKQGGRILTPEEICKEAEERGQESGDRHLCDRLNKLAEPKRSKQIIAAIEECSHSQERNIERYIEVTNQVEYERRWLALLCGTRGECGMNQQRRR